MRRTFFALFLAAGCIHGSTAAPRDDRMLQALAQQERWAQQALAARPTRDQLDAVRSSDYTAVGRARGDLKRMVQAIDRSTWIRNTAAELMADDPDPQLRGAFDRAGHMRSEAVPLADQLASALAEAKGGLAIADLRPGLEAVHKAQASEDRIARLPPRAGGVKLAPAPLPLPRPFIAPAARLLSLTPELTRELDRLPPADAAQIRARAADADRERAEQRVQEPPAVAAGPALTEEAPPPEPREAEAPSPTLTIANDAAALLAKRTPRSITLREDGLFELSYDDADYLVDPQGKLIRKQGPSAK